MRFDIYDNNVKVNTIISTEVFCKAYCEKNGYTYKIIEHQTSINEETSNDSSIEQLRADIDYLALMTGVAF